MKYDAVLLLAFGGPWKTEEVRPFLAEVARTRPVPKERLEEVAKHYEAVGGRSPLGERTFAQAEALEARLAAEGCPVPVVVGMRSWTPFVHDTLRELADRGARRVLGLILAAQSSEASVEPYTTAVDEGRERLGAAAPVVDYAGSWHDADGFIQATACRVAEAFARIPERERAGTQLVFTAHSIPQAMAAESTYVRQIESSIAGVVRALGHACWRLAYQSRSGPPREPWLEPDVRDVIREEARAGTRRVVVAPIGFVCDHVEVLYDLDRDAASVARGLGVEFLRAGTVDTHPAFIEALAAVVKKHLVEAGT